MSYLSHSLLLQLMLILTLFSPSFTQEYVLVNLADQQLNCQKFVEGPLGIQGAKGPQGLPGVRGLQGPKGRRGDTGMAGPIGAQGHSGTIGQNGFVDSLFNFTTDAIIRNYFDFNSLPIITGSVITQLNNNNISTFNLASIGLYSIQLITYVNTLSAPNAVFDFEINGANLGNQNFVTSGSPFIIQKNFRTTILNSTLRISNSRSGSVQLQRPIGATIEILYLGL